MDKHEIKEKCVRTSLLWVVKCNTEVLHGIRVRGRGKRQCQSEEGNSYKVNSHHILGSLSLMFYIICLGRGLRNVAWEACLYIDRKHRVGIWFSVQ